MRTLVTGGTVVSMDPAIGDLGRGDVLLEDGVIVEVAERIDAGDAEVMLGRLEALHCPPTTPLRPAATCSPPCAPPTRCNAAWTVA